MVTRVFMGLVLALLPAAAGAETLATVGKKTISRTEVEKEVQAQLVEVETQRYTVLKNGLDELVATALFEQEATARGTTVEELQKVEIVDKVQAPSDAEIQKVYDDNKEQLEGQSLDQVKGQLVDYLTRKKAQERMQAFIGELKKKYPTKIALRPPVVEVAIGSTPPLGNPKAPVTIIEFSDYQCPFCKKVEPTVQEVLKTYGDKVRFAYRNFPLPFHENARPAAEAAACVAEQGKFWPYHTKLMAATDLSAGNLEAMAVEVGADKAKFAECVKAEKFKDQIEKDLEAGQTAGVSGTPAFFINGRMIDGAQPFEKFKEVIDEEIENAGAGSKG